MTIESIIRTAWFDRHASSRSQTADYLQIKRILSEVICIRNDGKTDETIKSESTTCYDHIDRSTNLLWVKLKLVQHLCQQSIPRLLRLPHPIMCRDTSPPGTVRTFEALSSIPLGTSRCYWADRIEIFHKNSRHNHVSASCQYHAVDPVMCTCWWNGRKVLLEWSKRFEGRFVSVWMFRWRVTMAAYLKVSNDRVTFATQEY